MVYAVTIDADHPFFRLGDSGDGKSSIFIGAYKEYVPVKLASGVVIRAMMIQNSEEEDHPKGEQSEFLILANCKEKRAKVLEIWKRAKEGDPGVPLFNFKGKELADAISTALNNEREEAVDDGSALLIVVAAGCNFVKTPIPVPKPKTKTKEKEDPINRLWTA